MTTFTFASIVFFGTLGFLALSLVLWFLLRAQWHRVWLPTLRVLDVESTRLRKIKIQNPPWIPFVIFLLAVVGFLFFTSQPKTLVMQATTPATMRIHLFLDLGPSIARSVTIPQYVKRIEDVWTELAAKSRISVSTSHDGTVFFPTEFSQIQEKIYELGFHRGGIDLGSAIRQQKEKIGEVDGFILFSDGNLAAWQSLNWKFLADEMRVYWVDLRRGGASDDNVFFRDIRLASAPYDPTLEWDVEIERRGQALPSRRGTLKATLGSETLASIPWQLDDGAQRIVVRASIPGTMISQLSARDESAPLLWQVELFEPDALILDNTFRTPLKGLRQDALLVGEPTGERQLEDSFYQLRTALETFGFIPQRVDRWDATLKSSKFPFWVVAIDESLSAQETCPLSLRNQASKERLQNVHGDKGPLIWLMPTQASGALKGLCTCFQKLILAKSEKNLTDSAACQNVNDRQAFADLMAAWGVARLGGKISSSRGTFGWYQEDVQSGMSVAAFAIPLKPSRQLGLDHAAFPMLIKELLMWQGLLEESSFTKKAFSDWPRVSDLSQSSAWLEGTFDPAIQDSNIPVGASTLVSLSNADMPPVWTPSVKTLASADYRFQKEDYDPRFWIHLVLSSICFLMIVEILWNWRRRVRSVRPLVGPLLVVLSFFLWKAPNLYADVLVPVLGPRYDAGLETILKEIPLRTSLDFADTIDYQSEKPKTLMEPWYWVRDPALAINKDGSLKDDFRYWLKRGGFLVLQGLDQQALNKATARAFGAENPDARWQAIPPDHELMRSFYLLDALPSCRGQVWYGFIYDGRLAILNAPFDFLSALADRSDALTDCEQKLPSERKLRLFINITMVALTTDYKKDQIHMREILKRLH